MVIKGGRVPEKNGFQNFQKALKNPLKTGKSVIARKMVYTNPDSIDF